MNEDYNKMLPLEEIDEDIKNSAPFYAAYAWYPNHAGCWKQGAQWERNRAKKESSWTSVKEGNLPATDGWYFTKGGFRKYNIMYFRAGKFFMDRHSDTYDSGIEFYKPIED